MVILRSKNLTKATIVFLIIDDSEVFHLGASLKDLGKKWFAFSQLNKCSVEALLESIMIIKSAP
jgi:hypothetical protein